MKTIDLDVKKEKDNCIFTYHDYKKKRKKGGNCYATAVAVQGLDTVDLIMFFVDMLAREHKENQYMIEHDGIITFTVKCNNVLIYQGNHYDVEEMLKEGTYVFLQTLRDNQQNMKNAS